MVIDEKTAPPVGGMGGSIHSWERSLDPFHRDAFAGTGLTDEQLDNAITIGGKVNDGERKHGWLGLDWCGNPIAFVPDGTEMEGPVEKALKQERELDDMMSKVKFEGEE